MKRTRWVATLLLLVYGVLLIQVVVFKEIPTVAIGHMRFRIAGTHSGAANFVPFKTIASQLFGRGHRLISVVNLLGNVVLFVPVGILAPLALPINTWRKALVLGVGSSLLCEVLEVVFRVGIFDVDDLILNALGVVLGFGMVAVSGRRWFVSPAVSAAGLASER